MRPRIGIIAPAPAPTPTPTPTRRGGDGFAAGGARLGRVFLRLRQNPARIDLHRMRLRRRGGPLGRLILCARFRGIMSRRIVIRSLLRRACQSGFRVLLFGRRGIERGGEKLLTGNQWGNEERPGQETERAGSLFRTLRPDVEGLPLLFEQCAFFGLIHDRRLSSRSFISFRSRVARQIYLPGESFRTSGVMRRVVRRHVVMPYVEVIRRAHLADGVIQRMAGRHRSERALHVTRMIRTVRAVITVRAEIAMREVEPGQGFTRVMMAVALAAVVGRLGGAIVLLRLAVVLVRLAIVVLGILPTAVVLRVVVLPVLRVIVVPVVLGMIVLVAVLPVVVAALVIVVVLGMLRVIILAVLRIIVLSVVLGIIVLVAVLPVVVAALVIVVVLGMLRVIILAVLRIIVLSVVLGIIVLVAVLPVVVAALVIVVVLGMLRVIILAVLRIIVLSVVLGIIVLVAVLPVVVAALVIVVVLGMLRVIILAVLRIIVLSVVLRIIVFVAVLPVVVAALVIVIPLGRLENARKAAQDRHGFAPRFGFATVAGTCLVRITPSPQLSPTHAD